MPRLPKNGKNSDEGADDDDGGEDDDNGGEDDDKDTLGRACDDHQLPLHLHLTHFPST